MSHSPKKIWAGALSALLALFAALVVATPALAAQGMNPEGSGNVKTYVGETLKDVNQTLDAAFNNINTYGDSAEYTVQLGAAVTTDNNVTFNVTNPVVTGVTLDLNGLQLTLGNSADKTLIIAAGDLAITSSKAGGKVDSGNAGSANLITVQGGALTIKGATTNINIGGTTPSGGIVVSDSPSASLSINGGTVAAGIKNSNTNGTTATAPAVSITGGTVTGDITNSAKGLILIGSGTPTVSGTIAATNGPIDINTSGIIKSTSFSGSGNGNAVTVYQGIFAENQPTVDPGKVVFASSVKTAVKVKVSSADYDAYFPSLAAAQAFIANPTPGLEPITSQDVYPVTVTNGTATIGETPMTSGSKATIKQIGFNSTWTNAQKAIAAALGVKPAGANGQYTTAQLDQYVPEPATGITTTGDVENVMWAVVGADSASGAVNVAFSYTGATGGKEVWLQDGPLGAPTQDGSYNGLATPVAPIQGVTKDNVGFVAFTVKNTPIGDNSYVYPANYDAVAWVFNADPNYVPVAETDPIAVNTIGFQYTPEGSKTPVQATEYYSAMVGDDVTLPNTLTFANDEFEDQTINGYTLDGQALAVGSELAMPSINTDSTPIYLTPSWGETVTLNVGGNAAANGALPKVAGNAVVAFPDAETGIVADDAEDLTGDNTTYEIGATADDTLPELPVVVNATGAFMGWYTYDATDGYTLWEAGDSIADETDIEFYALMAPVSLAWTPSTGIALPGSSATSTMTASMNPATPNGITAINDNPVNASHPLSPAPEVSKAATQLFESTVTYIMTDEQEAPEQAPAVAPSTDLEYVTVQVNSTAATVNQTSFALEGSGLSWTATVTPAASFPTTSATTSDITVGFGTNVASDFYNTQAITGNASNSSTFTVDVVPLLAVNVAPSDSAGSVKQTVSGTSTNDAKFTLEAVPADGWHFDHWNGPLGNSVSTNPTITVTRSSQDFGTYTAVFAQGSAPATGQVPVTVMYNPNNGDHLFTAQASEVSGLTDLGWLNYGTAWNAPNSGAPVYRIYNPYSHDHYWATSKAEMDGLVKLGWQWDNGGQPVFYSATDTTHPVYQLFNPYVTEGTHYWTTSYGEYTQLQGLYWEANGISWYAASLAN